MLLGLLLEITTTPAAELEAIDFTWLFIKMMLALIIVCVLAVVILKYAVPRVGFFKKYANSQYIEVIARSSLDQKKFLYIVKVGSKYALVGASDHNVNLVMELSREDVESNS